MSKRSIRRIWCLKASKSRNRRDWIGSATASSQARLKLVIHGAVQGVGFRPFVHRLAKELHLNGWVSNSEKGVDIEVEGHRELLENFLLRLETEKPPHSFIQSLETLWTDALGYVGFEIRVSTNNGKKTALVLPDIASCPECLREIFDPSNRRYRYPFTNCTHCGPRFSIIECLPYDRATTSMKSFSMCAACQAEYDEPGDRRFHAQPNACAACGPHLEIWDAAGKMIVRDFEAIVAGVDAILRGQIVAVKGIGGFHLMADARNEEAVQQLRERKRREEKPLAMMFPSLQSAKDACEISPLEERLLLSSEAPIVLLRRSEKIKSEVADSVAPGNPHLGVMLPYSPLHHLLMAKLGFPVVATSGNLSNEPICTDEHEAINRLHGIADFFLVHNRPIVRHVDDSVVRVMLNCEQVLRRARGYAPLPIKLPRRDDYADATILAVGAHLKNAVALSVGEHVFLSQHIGDLETEQAYEAFRRTITSFENLYEARPQVIGADLHPDYLSTKFARALVAEGRPGTGSASIHRSSVTSNQIGPSIQLVGVQHHFAHVLSCMAENEISPPVLGVAWDGTGYGLDETIWGGEFFVVTDRAIQRIAHLDSFRLPGGEKAVKEPRRAALGILHRAYGDAVFERKDLSAIASFSNSEMANLKTMLGRGLNSPLTTSVGRLFDAMASLIDLRQSVSFEGQAAMELEFLADRLEMNQAYPMPLREAATEGPWVLDWRPMVETILCDFRDRQDPSVISACFHNGLAEGIVAVAKKCGEKQVAISGGCFQNRYLTERCVTRLREEGFRPYWHQRVPPSDGGVALGQIVAALRQKG
jgi:hydrogenase maturation protein HypF